MNILFIAPRLPYPADTGGKIRTLNILKQLAKQAKVHLVCFSFDRNDQELSESLKLLGMQVTLVPGRNLNLINKIMAVLLDPLPVTIKKYYSQNMESVLLALNEAHDFDAVHIDHLHMAHYQKCFDGVPCVIDEHNVEYMILQRCANVEKSFIKRIVFGYQSKKMVRFEKRSINDASTYFAVSQKDKDLLSELSGNGHAGHVVPNGVDTQYFDRQSIQDEEEAVVFTGSMDWLPNDDAAIYFCDEILPLIWKQHPELKFYIIGKNPSKKILGYARRDNRIICTGRVDDVRTYVEKSKIFIVPLRIGGGTRLKILEAMSMQKAVISTRIGAEGINCTENSDIILADKPQEFADKVAQLIDDDQKRATLGRAGRSLVLEQYDWDIIGKKLDKIYEQVKIKK